MLLLLIYFRDFPNKQLPKIVNIVSKTNQGSIIVIDTIQITEEQIVNQAKQGDRGAFGELVNRHYDSVIRVVYRLCGDMQLAQDAAQEAFIRA